MQLPQACPDSSNVYYLSATDENHTYSKCYLAWTQYSQFVCLWLSKNGKYQLARGDGWS